MTPGIDRERIAATYTIIQPYIRRTPIVEVGGADVGLAGGALAFKLEHLQHSGSFKTRGAFTNLLTRKIPEAGVVAASGGNHGAAVTLRRAVAGRARADLRADNLLTRQDRAHPAVRREAGRGR